MVYTSAAGRNRGGPVLDHHRTEARATQPRRPTMSIQQPTKNTTEPTAAPDTPIQTERGEHAYLGLDKTGAMHHYAEHESKIVVIKRGRIQHVERFADYDDRDKFATEWIDYIGRKREWEEQPYMTQHQFFDEGEQMGFQKLSEKLEGRA